MRQSQILFHDEDTYEKSFEWVNKAVVGKESATELPG